MSSEHTLRVALLVATSAMFIVAQVATPGQPAVDIVAALDVAVVSLCGVALFLTVMGDVHRSYWRSTTFAVLAGVCAMAAGKYLAVPGGGRGSIAVLAILGTLIFPVAASGFSNVVGNNEELFFKRCAWELLFPLALGLGTFATFLGAPWIAAIAVVGLGAPHYFWEPWQAGARTANRLGTD